jgi:hypothetical protein
VIKSLIILLLIGALLAAAALTRPSEADFKAWVRQGAEVKKGNAIEQIFEQSKVESYLDECTYHNRLLWADVEHKGQVAYSGAFGHWMNRSGGASAARAK